ncbi:ABC transporter permease [Alkalispirochaeta alkalica]|uniref:ABC transporter permease n=1 Tax=Alkalispirochaeta alkalica TaxID=46356 RepID=UPI000366DE77|nr:ABC transporter permease [Alkalispirochaeta alkalica]
MRIRLNRDFVIGLVTVFLGLLAGALLMALTGNNPLQGFRFLFRGSLMNVERFGNTLAISTPLILTGLSVAFAFRTGLFNIGSPGQVLVGGLLATVLGLTLELPGVLLLPVMTLAAIAGGAFWGFIPGYLKARFNVHEVVACIMMNWIAYWITYYTIRIHFSSAGLATESRRLGFDASLRVKWLTDLFQGSYVNLGIFLALAAVVVIAVILNNTVWGYQFKAVGFNRYAAENAGIAVQRNIVTSMMISGALSGLAGLCFYAGYAVNMEIGIMPAIGWDGIAVALLGAASPVGVVGAALFFGILQSGKGFMGAMTDIPPEVGDTIIAAIIYFAATSVLIRRVLAHRRFRFLFTRGEDNSDV